MNTLTTIAIVAAAALIAYTAQETCELVHKYSDRKEPRGNL